MLDKLPGSSSYLFVPGDSNINFLEDSLQKRQLLSLFLAFDMKQHGRDATRYGSLLDLVFTNINILILTKTVAPNI